MGNKYYKINFQSTGAEYTYGSITNQKEINLVKKTIKNGNEIGDSIEDNDLMLNSFEYTDIVHCFGPDVNSMDIKMFEYEDENFTKEINETNYLESNYFNHFTISNPYLTEELKNKYMNINKNTLLWCNQKIEKRINYPILIKLDENETLVYKNIFIGSINMDEIISEDEILTSIFYFTNETKIKILKEISKDIDNRFNDEYFKFIQKDLSILENDFIEILEEYYSNEKYTKLFDEYLIENEDIEGKGEIENNKSIITNLNNEILYEGDDY